MGGAAAGIARTAVSTSPAEPRLIKRNSGKNVNYGQDPAATWWMGARKNRSNTSGNGTEENQVGGGGLDASLVWVTGSRSDF